MTNRSARMTVGAWVGVGLLAVGTWVGVGLLLVASAAAAFTFDIPKPTGFVVDRVGVLDAATKKKLVDLNRELKEKTGAEIAVVVVPSTKPEPPFDYAMAIAESWKPGSAEKDNGIVFLVAVEDREMYILTGYGAEGPLPDGRVGEIRDRIVRPAFRRGDYAGGILEASATMAALLAQDAGVTLTGVPPPRPVVRRRARGSGLAGLLFLVILLVLLRAARRGGRRRRRGRDDLAAFLLGGMLGRTVGGRRHGGFGDGFGGGLGGGFGGGGFGGFGGGGFGGGGAGGRW